MVIRNPRYKKEEKKYLAFLKSQEVLSEPFRDKVGQLKNYYLPIGQMIFKTFLKDNKTKIIGLTGGQGSGKSTISNILKIVLKEYFSLETVIFSIDDFYKTFKERKILSKIISPLFLTRGVQAHMIHPCYLKSFKILKKRNLKNIDTKLIRPMMIGFQNKWLRVRKSQYSYFEGWCVGVTPQKRFNKPINKLEKYEDKKEFGEKS